MTLEISQQIFEKYFNINFHEDPSSGVELFHGQTSMTKLTVPFLNFATAL